jgi:hypothetical protein
MVMEIILQNAKIKVRSHLARLGVLASASKP